MISSDREDFFFKIIFEVKIKCKKKKKNVNSEIEYLKYS